MNQRIAGWIAAALLTGCASTPRVNPMAHYEGADAGFVILAAGGEKNPMFNFSGLRFQRSGSPDYWQTYFRKKGWGDIHVQEPDYDSKWESGNYEVRRLPPGRYLLTEVFLGSGGYSCSRKFAQPLHSFEVKPGEAVYIGHYRLTSWRGNCAQLVLDPGSANEAEAARTKRPYVPTGTPLRTAAPPASVI